MTDLNLTFHLPCEIQRAFNAWISEEYLVAPVVKIEINPVVGGVFRLTSQTSSGLAVMDGKILEIERNSRIRYSWHWGGPEPPSIVDVTFADSDGSTKVDVAHSGLQSSAEASGYEKGWNSYVKGLADLL